MPSGADRCLATEPSRSTTPWCGTLNREHELQRRPITLTARVHNALDKPRSFTDAVISGGHRNGPFDRVASIGSGRDRKASYVAGQRSANARPQVAGLGKSSPGSRPRRGPAHFEAIRKRDLIPAGVFESTIIARKTTCYVV